ncbi:hypothetical protein J6S88_01465 [bacterium]|nr:hypothetical protein [bacterium]
MNCFKVLGILCLLICCSLSADAGVFSKIGNWFNTGWNDYGYNQGYYNPPHRAGFYNNGNFTGITPPVNSNPAFFRNNGYYCPNSVNRFNHFPNGSLPEVNVPAQVMTDFSSNVGTGTRVLILD